MDSAVESLCDLLPIVGSIEHRRLAIVGKTADFGQNRRHLGGDEDDEWRPLDAPVFQSGIDRLQIGEELLL